MAYKDETKLTDATLGEYAEVLIRGNGFGHESLWIKSHFGRQQFGIVEESIDSYTHNIAQYVMNDFFEKEKKFKKVGETYYDDSGEVAVTFENLETDRQVFQKVYKNAMVMYERKVATDPDDDDEFYTEKLCVSINKYGPREITYRVYSPMGTDSIIQEWFKFAHANNMYKGKKIDADCQYLNLKDVTWSDLILPKDTKALIKMRVNEMFELKDFLDANDIPLKGGVILAGPPGTGKTVICKILAKELPYTVIYAMPDHLGRTGDIKRVCEMAKDLAPCILIIEDIDYIAEERDHSRNAGGVIELMNYLDGVQEFNDVITLATTNAQEKIEEALKNRPGRFDRVVQVPRPDEDCRERMLKNFASKFILVDDIDWDILVDKTDKLSGAHVKDLVKTAAMYAIRSKSVNEHKKAIVGMKHFKLALEEVGNVDWSTVSKMQNNSRKMGFNSED
jgi:AAA+ superfamily predicted ATPase